MSGRDARIMREMLADAGIAIDAPRSATCARPAARSSKAPAADRDVVRAILASAGAPARDLDWLVTSCPGEAEALAYRPTVHAAWCARCDGIVVADSGGCVACQAAAPRLGESGAAPANGGAA